MNYHASIPQSGGDSSEVLKDKLTPKAIVAALDDPATRAAAHAERAFLTAIGGDCHTPLAAYATVAGDRLAMRVMVASIDGREIVGDTFTGAVTDAVQIGERLAAALLSRGAAALIAAAGRP